MNLKDTLWEIFGKPIDEIGKIELSSTDKIRAMCDHIDYIYNGKTIFRGFNENKFIFTSVGLLDRNREIGLMLVFMLKVHHILFI